MAQRVEDIEKWGDKLRLDLPEIIKIPTKLYPIIYKFNNFRYFLLEGGRGSGKSQSVARFLLYLGEQRKIRIVCGREIQANIEESVYTILKDLIDEYDLAYIVQAQKITHKITGTTFKFKGFREQGSVNVKGLEGVDILWIDEAQSITKITLDTILPTIRKEKAKLFFTMNRFLREDAVPTAMIGNAECLHIQINYFENPFCPLNLKVQAENTKLRSERDYNHIWLGHPLAHADDYLFNFEKIIAAYDIKPFGDLFLKQKQRILAVDFAAQGNDMCVATVLDRVSSQHWQLTERVPWDEPDTMISVGKIVNMIGQFKPTVSILDIGGLGKPVYDRLIEVGIDINPFDGNSTEGVENKVYANKRAAGYYLLRDWFDSGFLCLERKDEEVVKQLEKIRMKYRSNGMRLIQSKIDMKKQPPMGMGYSPDDADSLMMAVWAASNLLGLPPNSTSQGSSSSSIKRKSGTSRGR